MKTKVYLTSSKDVHFESGYEILTLATPDIVLETNGEGSWVFRKIVGKFSDGTPLVDLDGPNCEIGLDLEEENVNLNWLFTAKFIDVVKMLMEK